MLRPFLRPVLLLVITLGVFQGCKTNRKSASLLAEQSTPDVLPTSPSRSKVCGDEQLDPSEQCDEGKDGGAFCDSQCRWRFCDVTSDHQYKEDEYPIAFCVGERDGVAAVDASCSTTALSQCFDCRGMRTDCARLKPGYAYSDGWSPPASDMARATAQESTAKTLALTSEDEHRRCVAYGTEQLRYAERNADNIPMTGFRFGYTINRDALFSNPSKIESWCLPPTKVNCAKWDTGPATWRAPHGCSCYTRELGRSHANCEDVTLFACPWASGSGCGLYFAPMVEGGTHCSTGPEPATRPHLNVCHFDIPGTLHDACCAKHWYVDKSFQFQKKNITEYECNGCNGSQGKIACPRKAQGLEVTGPRNQDFPCYDAWNMALAHNRLAGDTPYQWFRTIDTEQRFTAQEVADNNASPKILDEALPRIERSHRALKGQILLKANSTFATMSLEDIAAFCESGKAHVDIQRRIVRDIDVVVCD